MKSCQPLALDRWLLSSLKLRWTGRPFVTLKKINKEEIARFSILVDRHRTALTSCQGCSHSSKPAQDPYYRRLHFPGYTPYVKQMLNGQAVVAHHKGHAGPTLREIASIEDLVGITKWDVIHFNWGLWDIYGWEYAEESHPG